MGDCPKCVEYERDIERYQQLLDENEVYLKRYKVLLEDSGEFPLCFNCNHYHDVEDAVSCPYIIFNGTISGLKVNQITNFLSGECNHFISCKDCVITGNLYNTNSLTIDVDNVEVTIYVCENCSKNNKSSFIKKIREKYQNT